MRFLHGIARATLVTLCLGCGINGASAQSTSTATGNASSSSNSAAVAVGGSASAGATGGSVTFNSPGSTTSRIRQTGSLRTTPNAIAPGLGAAGVETCYGPGVSAGLGLTGFGASFGMGQYDQECSLRLWSRTAWAFGQKNLAGAIMMQSPVVQRAAQSLDAAMAGGGPVVYGRGYAVAGRPRGVACSRHVGNNPTLACLD